LKTGSKLVPSSVWQDKSGAPAASIRVAKKSGLLTGVPVTRPGGTTPGQRTSNGSRMPPLSYKGR
jgi:hypothetical protein